MAYSATAIKLWHSRSRMEIEFCARGLPNAIAVVGEVYEPGLFDTTPNVDETTYQLAGGVTVYALNKNIYILKANGSVSFPKRSVFRSLTSFEASDEFTIEAGDVLVVPTNTDFEPPLRRISL